MRSHAYRAALQEIIREKDPNIEHGSIKLTLKKAHDLPFPQYVQSSFITMYTYAYEFFTFSFIQKKKLMIIDRIRVPP